MTAAQDAPSDAPSPDNDSSRAPDTAQPAELRRELLALILRCSRAARMPARFTFLGRSEQVRTIRRPLPELLSSLRAAYADDQLRSAGIVVRGPEGQCRPSPVLVQNKFLVMTDRDGAAVDLMTDVGALFAAAPACAEFAAAPNIAANSRQQPLFLGNIADVQVLTQLGFLCTTAAGLPDLDAAGAHVY